MQQVCTHRFNKIRLIFACALASRFVPAVLAQSNQAIYTDSLQNGWANWSWATVNLANPSPTHAGSSAISISSTNWQALYLHHNAQAGSMFTNLSFWVNGGSTGGQVVQ